MALSDQSALAIQWVATGKAIRRSVGVPPFPAAYRCGAFRQERQCRPSSEWQGALRFKEFAGREANLFRDRSLGGGSERSGPAEHLVGLRFSNLPRQPDRAAPTELKLVKRGTEREIGALADQHAS